VNRLTPTALTQWPYDVRTASRRGRSGAAQLQFVGDLPPLTGFVSMIGVVDRLLGRKQRRNEYLEPRVRLAVSAFHSNEGVMKVTLKLCPKRDHIVRVEGPLLTPVTRTLRHRIWALLRHGERRIVLDLSGVSRIDAAGVGELIRTFNMTAAVSGALRIVNASAWVREILERAHLFELLNGEREVEQRLA